MDESLLFRPLFPHKESFPIINEMIVKLASRCNINCTYCYWFNDPRVMNSPKILLAEAEVSFLVRLEEHIHYNKLSKFYIAFHGGEPTLFPKARFESLCLALKQIENRTFCKILLSMQSNALLIDDEWIALLNRFSVTLGVSLDGSKQLHDRYRIDSKGRGTYLKTIQSIQRIKNSGMSVYILAVASTETSAGELLDHLVGQLGIKDFAVLMPHLHHENEKISLAEYFCEMFDRYLEDLIDIDVNIRILDDLMCQIIGGNSNSQGYGFVSTVTLLTDGQLEATDDLRMISNLPVSQLNIKTHAIQQITEDPLWQEVYNSSINLAESCNQCQFKRICGGGPLVSRWSNEKRFANPSVYCKDYQAVISHMQLRLQPHLERLQSAQEESSCQAIS